MEENNKNYIVTLSSGQRAQLSEEEYNERKDAIFAKDKYAQVARINQFNPDDEIDDNSFYSVGLPDGKLAVLSADEYKQRADKLRSVEGVQIGSVSPVDYWGNKLDGINTQIGEIETRLNANKSAFNSKETDIDIEEDADASKNLNAAQRGFALRKSINDDTKALEALKKERESNPAWQGAKQKQIDNLQSESDRIDNEIRGLDTIYPGAREQSEKVFMLDRPGVPMSSEISKLNPEYERDSMALTAAKMYYNDALKAAKAPSRYGDETGFGNFFRGLAGNAGEALSITSLVKAGLSTALIDTIKNVQEKNGENTNFIELVQNPEQMKDLGLSAAQQEVLKAFVVKSAVDAERSEDMSLGYQAGKSAVQSLGFMADFMLFGGAPEAVSKSITKGLVKSVAKQGLKGVARQAAKFGVGTLQGAVKTLLMTPAMPSSWANFTQNLATMDEAGQVDMSGKAILRDVGDVLIENFSENAGGQIEALLGSPAKLGSKLFKDTKFGDWAKALSNTPAVNFLKQGGWNGLFGEIGEEWYGNALRVMTGVDKDALRDFATVDQQIITLASFAPMTLIGGAASSAQFLAAKKQMKNAGDVLSNLLERQGYDKETIANILDASKAETPAEISSKLTPVVNQIARDNGDGSLAYTAAMDYAKAISRYRAFEGSQLVDMDEKRNIMESELLNRLQRDYRFKISAERGDNTYTGSRVRAIDVDGKRGYLIAQDSDGEYSVNYNDNTLGYLTEDQIKQGVEDGSMQDTGWMSREDYLDMELAAKKDGEQRQRIDTEYRTRLEEIRQRALPGVQINIGTAESPIVATIRGWNGEKFIVESAERGAEEYDVNQMGAALDVNMHVETDEEIENRQADEIISNEEIISKINAAVKGMPISVNGKNYLFGTAFNPHRDEDGNWLVDVFPSYSLSDTEEFPEDRLEMSIASLHEAFKAYAPVMAEANMETEEEKTAEVSAEETAEDNIPRDFRGNPLPLKEDGTVNQTALWNNDPEAWAKWNDANPNKRIDTKTYVQGRISALEGDIKKLEKAIDKETKTTGDFDAIDGFANQIDEKLARQAQLQKILDNYAAEEKAAAEKEKARQLELSEPQSISQLAINVLKGVKAHSLNRDSFKKELGWGNKELSVFFPWWAKKGSGMSLDALAEKMVELDNQYGFVPMVGDAEQKDTQVAKDALIEVMQSISRPGELRDMVLNENKAYEDAIKDAQEAAAEAELMSRFGMTIDEYNALSEEERAALDSKQESAAESGPFGPITQWAPGNALEAAKHLLAEQTGYYKDVFYSPIIGNVDLIWGDEIKGLRHIIERHINKYNDFVSLEEAISVIDDVISNSDDIDTSDPKKSKSVKMIIL